MLLILLFFFQCSYPMSEVLEQHRVTFNVFSEAAFSLHSLIQHLSFQTINAESGKFINIEITSTQLH